MNKELSIKVSLFEGTRDNNPTEIITTWDEFASNYLLPHEVSDTKENRSLFAPALFLKKRSNSDVIEYSALAIDFDDGVYPEALTPAWKAMGLEYVIYQTFGCTPEHPKWRAVFPLAEPVSVKDYELKKDVMRDLLAQGYDDKATRDAARIYYLPTINKEYYSKPALSEWNKGEPLDPSHSSFTVAETNFASAPKQWQASKSELNDSLGWWDEFNQIGYPYACYLLQEAGWTCLDDSSELDEASTYKWAKPGERGGEHHATIRYYSNSGLFMFHCFTPKADPFGFGKTYNWTTLVNMLLFPEEHESGSKSKLWRHLSKLDMISQKANSYKIESFDVAEIDQNNNSKKRPTLELFPVCDLASNVIDVIAKINNNSDDIDKIYLSPQNELCRPRIINGNISSSDMTASSLCGWLEARTEITKEGDMLDGIPQAYQKRIGAVSDAAEINDLAKLPFFRGFSTFPTIAIRNAKTSKPYYDEQSKKIVFINKESQDVIRNSFESPSYKKAKRSAEKLRGIFADSPFLSENDWNKTLALILTPFLSDVYQDSIPIGVIKASQAETGKSELAKGISAFCGSVNSKDYNKSMDLERALATYIIDDNRVFILDNLNGYFEDDFISNISTSRELSVRQLYKEPVTTPCNMMIILTANNPKLGNDITSRSIEVNIHVNQANPGSRVTKYKVLPKNYILNNYHKCLAWIMDIIAYGLSCSPTGQADYVVVTRHANWERLIQKVLNPIDIYPNFAKAKEMDDEDHLATYIRNWWNRYGEDKVTTSQLTRLAFYDNDNEGLLSYLSDYQMIHTKDESNEKLLYKSLGNIITKHRNKCYKFSDNLEVKIIKGRSSTGMFYTLECLSRPEGIPVKQMTFDEVADEVVSVEAW